MKQRQHIFQSWVIEVITVLLASTISFPISDALGVRLSILPFVMVACYVALKLIYHLCLSLSAHIISLASLVRHKPTQSDRQSKDDCAFTTAISMVGNDNIQMKRMELFHYEYQHEEWQYLQQKEREEDEKLQAVLQYTRNIFKQFDFSEEEIFQICECVRYFVSNRQALSVNIHIKRRTTVTQISLKNFAWNIAFQYNISRDVTAQFVMHTFHEWFANSTIDTVRKNLYSGILIKFVIAHNRTSYSKLIISLTLTSNNSDMRFSVAKSGWVVLVHHLETVVWFTPNCSANHLLVLFFLTNTSFN